MIGLRHAARHAKPLMLALVLILALPGIIGTAQKFAQPSGQFNYFLQTLIVWLACLCAGFIPNAALRWIGAMVLAFGAYYLLVYEYSTSRFMTYDAFINTLDAAGFVGAALDQNRAAFIAALPSAILLLVAVGLAPHRRLPVSAWLMPLIPLAGLAAVTGFIYLRGGEGADDQPPGLVAWAYAGLAGYEAATGRIGERQPVTIAAATRPLSRNIVLIVDESIAADYLDINARSGVRTALAQTWPGVAIHNYGRAASVTNCSAGSNATLRFGGTRRDYLTMIATAPSIWAYARKAGMRTVYIDAQHNGGKLQNYMNEAERAEIDRFVQFDGVSVTNRDMAVSRVLREELDDPQPKFILVNKAGAHFPIQDVYPDEYLLHRPALERSKEGEQYFIGVLRGFKGTPPEWERYRNSYRNTLAWRVGAFFDDFFTNADLSETTVIYTADHGQDLHEDGSSGLYTHCGPDAAPAEGAVPMVVIEGSGGSGLNWAATLPRNRDRTSHFMIFPTLLALMGYDRDAGEKRYGEPLDKPSTDPGTFNTVFNARLNRQPEWLSISPETVTKQAHNTGRLGKAGMPAAAE